MKNTFVPCLLAISAFAGFGEARAREVDTAWKSKPPQDCPFVLSRDMPTCTFTGRYANYCDADTWYPSWGADGKLYSPFTDTIGNGVNGVMSRSDGGEKAVIGHATISGDDPMHLTVTNPGTIPGPGGQYPGRYPCASLHYNGVWYIGTYGLASSNYGLNFPILGPFGGFHISTDNGKTWTPSPRGTDLGKALFPEPPQFRGPVKLGSPHVVDFGKNMKHSPDGKMYLVGHGSTEMDQQDRKANLSWVTGDQIYLCRVKPSPQTINDESQYEYFAGHNADGKAIWSADFSDLKPIAEWDNKMGCVTIFNVSARGEISVKREGQQSNRQRQEIAARARPFLRVIADVRFQKCMGQTES